MIRLSTILPLAAITALATLAAAPATAFVGYGVESGEEMYDALQRGYRPDVEGRDYYYYAPPPRRGLRRYR